MRRPALLALAIGVLAACGPAGSATMGHQPLASEAGGTADDGSPATPAATYDAGTETLWAADSLTTAFSDPPRAARLSGGVTAQPIDTVIAPGVGSLAEAASRNRVVTPLVVEEGGRFTFELALDLRDVQLAGDGRAVAAVRAVVADHRGTRVLNGEVGPTTIELRPDGSVIVDGMDGEPDVLDPSFGYSHALTGPAGGVELAPGSYRVELELFLEATAPLAAGGPQLAAIGQAVAGIALR